MSDANAGSGPPKSPPKRPVPEPDDGLPPRKRATPQQSRTDPAAAARRNEILSSYRTRWKEQSGYTGRARYWLRQHSESHIELKDDNQELEVAMVQKAIAAVTEAIQHPLGQPAYSLLSGGQTLAIHEMADFLEGTLVARPGKQLILPWYFYNPLGKRPLPSGTGTSFQQQKPSSQPTIPGERTIKEDHRHTLLAVAQMINGYPWFQIFNSSDVYHLDDSEMTKIVHAVGVVRWCPVSDQGPVPPESMFTVVPAASQKGAALKQPCGIHTILNGWAVAMGLGRLINPSCTLNDQTYKSAIQLINLVLGGRADFWVVYFWLIRTKFVFSPRDKDGVTISFRSNSRVEDMEGEEHILLLFSEGGARYFDCSIRMKNDLYLDEIWQDALEIDITEENQRRMDLDKARKALLEPSMPGPAAEPSSQLNARAAVDPTNVQTTIPEGSNSPQTTETMPKDTLKEKIEGRLRLLLQEHYGNEDEGEKVLLSKAVRSCFNLASLVQDHLSPPGPRRDGSIQNFKELAGLILGLDNFLPTAIIWKALTVVLAEEFGADICTDDVIGEKLELLRRGLFPVEELDYEVVNSEDELEDIIANSERKEKENAAAKPDWSEEIDEYPSEESEEG